MDNEVIAAAKELDVYTGRKPRNDPAEVRRLRTEEKLSPAAIAKRLEIAIAPVCRSLPRAGLGA